MIVRAENLAPPAHDGWEPTWKGMDGRMDASKISLDPYVCAFDHTKNCPIRTMFKLQPENLLGYCAICYINPINKQEPKRDIEISEMQLSYDVLFKLLDMYSSLPKEEREPFLEAAKSLSERQMQARQMQ